ncbi:lipid A 3-O-deacylase [Andreprevotia lacus DSM 23236]|jgi:hypothetical protein|uniref:Lipid A 3-O-deacylase n=1 Tax=Andreprevotia lacus DSM 23236 TaxID=1121001 RepID=A0A1W1XYM5_9NEIS|nr:acyloxyacyl hydrolase [Andreprevotia lacus]SMC28661.1 lipid A 3-O-deacylase [Andreprevotia lacus DSM 23236]
MGQLRVPFALLIVLFAAPVLALDHVDLAVGQLARPTGSSAPNVVQASAGWNLPWHWLDSDSGQLQSRLDVDAGYIGTASGDVWHAAISPVLRYQWHAAEQRGFFVEASIGLAWVSAQHWNDEHDMGTRVLFADRLGMGYRFGMQEVGLHVLHYSNADTAEHNAGAEVVYLRYGRWF